MSLISIIMKLFITVIARVLDELLTIIHNLNQFLFKSFSEKKLEGLLVQYL